MNDGASRPCLSALFVDYDNIYLSLKRKNEEAAKQFAKNAGVWLRGIDSGALITPTNAPVLAPQRRIVLNRCYGNPVPRRSNKDNSTDMNSFPFVRHHFLRAGSEIVDCPPLTAQLKNSSDIRMVMDIRDLLNHDTYYDEFIILSGDADFTPVLHRLRAHARRTIIYANDYTAVPYTAISDGEIQEKDLINFLITGHVSDGAGVDGGQKVAAVAEDPDALKTRICDEIEVAMSESETAVPIESLADRAQRSVGHEQTIGTNWVGHGNFLTFLEENLPDHIKLTEHAPYFAIDTRRMSVDDVSRKSVGPDIADVTQTQLQAETTARSVVGQELSPNASVEVQPIAVAVTQPVASEQSAPVLPDAPATPERAPVAEQAPPAFPDLPVLPDEVSTAVAAQAAELPVAAQPQQMPVLAQSQQAQVPQAQQPSQSEVDATSAIQRSIARIHDACQAPPLAPPEYRMVFELIALELRENNLNGQQTVTNIVARAQEAELDVKRDDVRFIIDVISEADPWFEQGASAPLFAGRFRNFVVARCRGQGLKLTVDELELIDAWFAGQAGGPLSSEDASTSGAAPMIEHAPAGSRAAQSESVADQNWREQDQAEQAPARAPIDSGELMAEDELPRIVRSRMRG